MNEKTSRKHSCGGEIQDGLVALGEYLVDARVCQRCNEAEPDLVQAQLVLAHNRYTEFDEPGHGTLTTVGRGSFAIRLPIEIVRSYMLQPGAKIPLKASHPGVVELVLNPAAGQIIHRESVQAPKANDVWLATPDFIENQSIPYQIKALAGASAARGEEAPSKIERAIVESHIGDTT